MSAAATVKQSIFTTWHYDLSHSHKKKTTNFWTQFQEIAYEIMKSNFELTKTTYFSLLVHENECVIRNFQHRKQNFYYSLHYAVRTKIVNQSTITNEMKSSNIVSHVVFQSSTSCALSGIWTNARMWNDSGWIQLLFTSGVWFLLLERTHGAICIFIAQTPHSHAVRLSSEQRYEWQNQYWSLLFVWLRWISNVLRTARHKSGRKK